MPDDPPPSLARIRETAEAEIVHPDDECGPEVGGYCTPHAALVLAGALEAVLKRHQGDVNDDYPDETPVCAECGEWVPCSTVKDITAALDGKEAGDDRR